MTNARIADVFDEIADLLEVQGANPFRVRAYRNASRTLRDLAEPVAAIVADGQRKLTDIEGIGEDLADKCATLVKTGELPQLNELRQAVPQGVRDLLRIPGLGPKKAAALHKELGITSLDELKTACQSGRVRELKGFGAKTEKMILEGISTAVSGQVRMLWAEADQAAKAVLAHLRTCPEVNEMEVAGSYRRGKETVGDLDVLVTSPKPAVVMDCFASLDGTADVLARGETKMSIRLDSGLQIDLRIVPDESFGAALQYFTGSKDHNIILRARAREHGLKINEYGVFRIGANDDEEGERVAGRTEKEIYAALDLPLFPPELREARKEFDWAAAGVVPDLIELDDIRGDLHMHTSESDGKSTIEEMAAAARKQGLSYIAITDHSQRVTMAHGLDPKRLRRQWAAIDKLNADQPDGFVILKGIECDILEKGGMDLPDDVLAESDWVLASVHYGQKQPRQQITDRIVGALANPHVCVVAHPTGRLLGRREPYEVDLEAVFDAAEKYGKLLELNSNPLRLDLNDVYCAAAKEREIPIVINTDAHAPEQLAFMRYGIVQARRGGLTKKDVANTRTWPQLKKLVGSAK
jgi:DNA polymerase (family 10)